MRALVGAFGMGNGHATRVQPLIDELLRQGDEVMVVASGQAYQHLVDHFQDAPHVQVVRVEDPIQPDFEGDQLRTWGTFKKSLKATEARARHNREARKQMDAFAPQVLFNDFEAVSQAYARRRHLPIVTVDNYQALTQCKLSKAARRGMRLRFWVWQLLVWYRSRGTVRSLIPTLAELEVKKKYARRATTISPMVRRPFVTALREPKDHLVVYVSRMDGNQALLETLRKSGLTCIIYNRDAQAESLDDGNLKFRSFDATQIIEDLRTARGAILTAGLSLMSEAFFLGVPVLSLPIHNHVEQRVNATLAEQAGYALVAEELDEKVLNRFLEESSTLSGKLNHYPWDGYQAPVQVFQKEIQWAKQQVGEEYPL